MLLKNPHAQWEMIEALESRYYSADEILRTVTNISVQYDTIGELIAAVQRTINKEYESSKKDGATKIEL